ncbi:MAG: response regulator transcription factor [Chloroflexi bacterium]|nr:response regulator transcription factor [Chloroflexota bacterium]MBI3764389.1 response regulator transcription factor [Chloroflexota bacterium]
MPQTILVVDDEPQLVKVLRGYLEQAGFRVVTAGDGPMALTQHKHEKPDLVLLDLNLPGIDGIDVARRLRASSNVPIIMVTARVEETDRLIGLELGADDYVTKPFSPREVVARVRAVLRRAESAPAAPEIIRAADIVIDLVRHSVARGGESIELTPTEFGLLATLAREPGRAFTRLQLLEAAQGDSFEGYERTVDAHIKNLRAKIERDPKKPEYVVTVFGVGYKFADG